VTLDFLGTLQRTHTCGELRSSNSGQTVTLMGWVNRRRDHGNLIFLDLRDRTGITQVVSTRKSRPKPTPRPKPRARVRRRRHRQVLRNRGEGLANPNMPTGDVELVAHAPAPQRREDASLLARRRRHRQRGSPPPVPLHRPPPLAEMQKNFAIRQQGHDGHPQLPRLARLPRDRNPLHDAQHPRRRARLPRPQPRPSRPLLRAPAVAADLQADPHDLRLRSLLPDRPLLPRRRPPRRPPARVHPDRPRDQLPADVDHLRGSRRLPPRRLLRRWHRAPRRALHPDDLRPGHPEVRHRQARHAPPRHGRPLARAHHRTPRDPQDRPALPVLGFTIPKVGRCPAPRRKSLSTRSASSSATPASTSSTSPASAPTPPSSRSPRPSKASSAPRCPLQRQLPHLRRPRRRHHSQARHARHVELRSPVDLQAHRRSPPRARQKVRRQAQALRANHTAADFKFLWVTDFPMYEWNEETKTWDAAHHPFTSPHEEDIKSGALVNDKGSVRALAYDVVLNGTELGSGSIRIHRKDVQSEIFRSLGMSTRKRKARFGFFLDALEYGTPPHGGIALGLDRIVMILAGASSPRSHRLPQDRQGHRPHGRRAHLRQRRPTPRAQLEDRRPQLVDHHD
jgi:hypothetical protein